MPVMNINAQDRLGLWTLLRRSYENVVIPNNRTGMATPGQRNFPFDICGAAPELRRNRSRGTAVCVDAAPPWPVGLPWNWRMCLIGAPTGRRLRINRRDTQPRSHTE